MTVENQAPQPTSAVTDLIDRHRRIWFVLVGLFLVVSFNGQWRVGTDSAAYRQLGHQLATNGRYFFRDDLPGIPAYHNQQGTRYPGLPLMLAAVEKLFGPGDAAPLALMMGLSIVTLVLVYRLMLYQLPRWLAVCVVTGIGTNPRFILYTNEILSDVPFLLGVVMALLGYERVLRSPNRLRLILDLLLTFGGLILAASMRPTFLMLGASLVTACLWGIFSKRVGLLKTAPPGIDAASKEPRTVGSEKSDQSPNTIRSRSLLILAMLGLAVLAFASLIDIRQKHGPGGYEARLLTMLNHFGDKVLPLVPGNIGELLEDALPMALLGARAGWGLIALHGHQLGAGALFSVTILVAGTLLVRRTVLWGSFVFITVIFLIFAGPIPRYFLMILPFLLAGWGLLSQWLGHRFKNPFAASTVMRAMLMLILLFNLVTSSAIILMQRGFTQAMNAHHHWQGFKYVGFLKAYHFGLAEPMYPLGKLIADHTKPRDLIIGPEANTLTYFSGRNVYEPIGDIRRLNHGNRVHQLAVFPVEDATAKVDPDYIVELGRLLRFSGYREGKIVAGPSNGYCIAELIYRPAAKHKKKPRRPTTGPIQPAVKSP